MKRALLAVAALAALIFAGAAAAMATGLIMARSGDQIVVGHNLRCFVGAASISCGGRAKISAEIKSNGEIDIISSPDPRAAILTMSIRQASCTTLGRPCSLSVKVP